MKVKVFGLNVFEIEQRSQPAGTATNPSEKLIEALGGHSTAGVAVNEKSSLTFSAVFGCVRVLSESLALLPLQVYERDGDDNRKLAKTNPLYYLLHNHPSQLYTSFNFRLTLMTHLVLWGNAYARIVRNQNGTPVELIIEYPTDVDTFKINGGIYYRVSGITNAILASDMLHFKMLSLNGITGLSPIKMARENIGLGLAAQDYGARFFGQGGNMDGVLELPGTMAPAVYERLKKDWKEKWNNTGKRDRETLILEGGAKYNRISIPPEDAQFLQTRRFSISEVARIYRVPLHMLADLERSTNNNIEHQEIEFWKNTMLPYVRMFEEEMTRKLISRKDQEKYYTGFNMNGMLRGDIQSRSDFYRNMFNIGALSPNDILKLEDMNAFEGGEMKFVPLNMAPIEKVAKELNTPTNND